MKKLGNEKPNAINIATANLVVIVTKSLLKWSADTVGFCIDDCGALFD